MAIVVGYDQPKAGFAGGFLQGLQLALENKRDRNLDENEKNRLALEKKRLAIQERQTLDQLAFAQKTQADTSTIQTTLAGIQQKQVDIQDKLAENTIKTSEADIGIKGRTTAALENKTVADIAYQQGNLNLNRTNLLANVLQSPDVAKTMLDSGALEDFLGVNRSELKAELKKPGGGIVAPIVSAFNAFTKGTQVGQLQGAHSVMLQGIQSMQAKQDEDRKRKQLSEDVGQFAGILTTAVDSGMSGKDLAKQGDALLQSQNSSDVAIGGLLKKVAPITDGAYKNKYPMNYVFNNATSGMNPTQKKELEAAVIQHFVADPYSGELMGNILAGFNSISKGIFDGIYTDTDNPYSAAMNENPSGPNPSINSISPLNVFFKFRTEMTGQSGSTSSTITKPTSSFLIEDFPTTGLNIPKAGAQDVVSGRSNVLPSSLNPSAGNKRQQLLNEYKRLGGGATPEGRAFAAKYLL